YIRSRNPSNRWCLIMSAYILRRILMMIPTLFGIMVLNFIIVQAAPGGPVEQMVAKLTSLTSENGATARISGSGSDLAGGAINANINSVYRGARGLDPEILTQITK